MYGAYYRISHRALNSISASFLDVAFLAALSAAPETLFPLWYALVTQ
ncbi:hypothetical protein H6G58_21330 [Arthrospira platensis FACHB-971]|nr:hypothetical protein [Arthrospira platensis FACHB-971]